MSRLATRLGLSVMVLVAVLTACATDELTRTPPGLAPAQGTALTAIAPGLKALGHKIRIRRITSGLHGFRATPGGYDAAADPRREGMALGD